MPHAVPHLGARPARRVAVITCMDARIDPLAVLGLELGDAHVIRNAGGLVTDDALRSLTASQRFLGTEEVVVMMHEGCGLDGDPDDPERAAVGAFASLEDELRAGVARVREGHGDRVRGVVYDPASGELRDVTS